MSLVKTLSIIIPAYNEERTIHLILDKVRDVVLRDGISKDVVIVNDGSTDGTAAAVLHYQEANPAMGIRFILLTYNIMALFKQKVMTNSRVQHQLSTIRFQCIAIGSYLVKNGRNKVMKLSAQGRRRHFLEHFFDQVELLKPPFKFAIA